MPVTSEVRLTKVFVIAPATARRMPERLPIETSPETATLPAKVEVALLDVAMKLPLVVLGTTRRRSGQSVDSWIEGLSRKIGDGRRCDGEGEEEEQYGEEVGLGFHE